MHEADCFALAKRFEGCGGPMGDDRRVSPESSDWLYCPDFSLFNFIEVHRDRMWWQQFKQLEVQRGYPFSWLEKQEHLPIVVMVRPIRFSGGRRSQDWVIWDGWHRVMNALDHGDITIKAVVGFPSRTEINDLRASRFQAIHTLHCGL